MTRHRIEFDEDELSQFEPPVREALTRLAAQQLGPPLKTPGSPGGVKVLHRETPEEIEARIEKAAGRPPVLVDRLSPNNYNPVRVIDDDKE